MQWVYWEKDGLALLLQVTMNLAADLENLSCPVLAGNVLLVLGQVSGLNSSKQLVFLIGLNSLA